MTAPEAVPEKADRPLTSLVDGVRLPVVKASQIVNGKAGRIVNEIAEQAPLYGLSGAILAVGLVTGRRALARTGAQMLTSQVIAALARVASERLLADEGEAKQAAEVAAKPAGKMVATEPSAVADASSPAKTANAARIATGALAGAAAVAAGGWLLSRLLKRKSADGDETKD